jgi:hypothetical protein
MQYEISIKVGSGKPGCDPEAFASLGRMAQMVAGSLPETEEPEEPAEPCESGTGCAKSSLGAKAREYTGPKAIRKGVMDIFDVRKEDLSNRYAEPETTGKLTK